MTLVHIVILATILLVSWDIGQPFIARNELKKANKQRQLLKGNK